MGDQTDTTGKGQDELGKSDSTQQEPSGDQTQTQAQPDGKKTSADEDWEKRFKGLQPVHQTLVESSKALKTEHEGLQAQYALDQKQWQDEIKAKDLQVTTLQADLQKAQENLASASQSTEELQGTIDSLEVKLERNALIMSEYPDLAPLEAKGLISDSLEGDDLTKALNDLRSLMVTKGTEAIQDLGAGASGDDTHQTGSRGQGMGVSDIGAKLMEAQKNRNMEEVNRLTELLIKQAQTEVFTVGE